MIEKFLFISSCLLLVLLSTIGCGPVSFSILPPPPIPTAGVGVNTESVCDGNDTHENTATMQNSAGLYYKIYSVSIDGSGNLSFGSTPDVPGQNTMANWNTVNSGGQNAASMGMYTGDLAPGWYTVLLCDSEYSIDDPGCSITASYNINDSGGSQGNLSIDDGISVGDRVVAPWTPCLGGVYNCMNLYEFQILPNGTFQDNGSPLIAVATGPGAGNVNAYGLGTVNYVGCDTPLIVHVGSQGPGMPVSLSSPSDGVKFDIRADSHPIQLSWPTQPDVDMFLALPNAQGQIVSGQQLFGNYTVGPDGKTSSNGFEALAKYAAPGAKSLDKNSKIFDQLVLWQSRWGSPTK
jgi:hypothetical protein